MCRKVSHKTLRHAVIALKAQPDKCLAPYQCPECGKWHLTQNRRGNRYFQDFIDRVRAADAQRASKTPLTGT